MEIKDAMLGFLLVGVSDDDEAEDDDCEDEEDKDGLLDDVLVLADLLELDFLL